MTAHDARLHSPAAERNREPLLRALRERLPERGTALEIACGSGQHAAHFAAALPGWTWWPSDADAAARASTAAWCAGLANVRAPLALDVHDAPPWPGVPAALELVLACNLLHIAPPSATAALMRGAAAHLGAQGRLAVYGPFVVPGEPTAPSNLAFDADLRARDPRWGLRTLDAVTAAARDAGLVPTGRVAMPANNLLLWFEPAPRAGSAPAT